MSNILEPCRYSAPSPDQPHPTFSRQGREGYAMTSVAAAIQALGSVELGDLDSMGLQWVCR